MGSPYLEYRFQYDQSPKRRTNRLLSVQKCGFIPISQSQKGQKSETFLSIILQLARSGFQKKVQRLSDTEQECTEPTQFTYTSSSDPVSLNFRKLSTLMTESIPSSNQEIKLLFLDKKGNGFPGLGFLVSEAGEAIFRFILNDGTGKLRLGKEKQSLGSWGPEENPKQSYEFFQLDKNGDGLKDLVKVFRGEDGRSYVSVYLSEPDRLTFQKESIVQRIDDTYIVSGKGKPSYLVRDLDGDGLEDLIQMKPVGEEPIALYEVKAFYADLKGGFPRVRSLTQALRGLVKPNTRQRIEFLDLDGDSLSDLFFLGDPKAFKTTGLEAESTLSVMRRKASSSEPMLASLINNRDGKKFEGAGSSGQAFLSLGEMEAGTLPPYQWLDFNTDGLKDLLMISASQSQRPVGKIWINQGLPYRQILVGPGVGLNKTQPFLFYPKPGEDPAGFQFLQFGDIDGDGRADLLKPIRFQSPEKGKIKEENIQVQNLEVQKNNSQKNNLQGNIEPLTKRSPSFQRSLENIFQVYINTGHHFRYIGETPNLKTSGELVGSFSRDLDGNGVLDVVSVERVNGRLLVTSWENPNLPDRTEITKISEGRGRQLTLEYGQLNRHQVLSYHQKPEYPQIFYQKPKRLIIGYQDENRTQPPFYSKRSFEYRYHNAVYNRLDWSFSGFQQIDKIERGRDRRIETGYFLSEPFVGKIQFKRTLKQSSNKVFNTKSFTYRDKILTNPSGNSGEEQTDSIPDIHILLKTGQKEQDFSIDPNTGESRAYRTRQNTYGYQETDPYGSLSWSLSQDSGSEEKIMICYNKANFIEDSHWFLGITQGQKTSLRETCQNPEDTEWDPEKDLRQTRLLYSDQERFNLVSAQVYRAVLPIQSSSLSHATGTETLKKEAKTSTNPSRNQAFEKERPLIETEAAWAGVVQEYDVRGRVIAEFHHSHFADRQGKYPPENQSTKVEKTYDSYGLLKTKTLRDPKGESLVYQYRMDPVTGQQLQITYPNGRVIKTQQNGLGLQTARFETRDSGDLEQVLATQYRAQGKDERYTEIALRIDWEQSDQKNWYRTRHYRDGRARKYRLESDWVEGLPPEMKRESVLFPEQKKIRFIESQQTPPGQSQKVLIQDQIELEEDTGRILYQYLPYFAGETAEKITLYYTERGQNKEKRLPNGALYTNEYQYSENQETQIKSQPDPSSIQEVSGADYSSVLSSRIYQYDLRKLSEKDPLGREVQTEYNVFGQPIQVLDARGLVSHYQYDSLGRLSCHKTPDTGKTCHVYDARDRIVTMHMANGASVSIQYDGFGRKILTQSEKAGNIVKTQYVYDEMRAGFYNKGLLTTVIRPDSKIELNYSAGGRLRQRSVFLLNQESLPPFVFQYKWNALGKLVELQYPDGSSIQYAYQNSIRPQSVSYRSSSQEVWQQLASFKDFSPRKIPSSIEFGKAFERKHLFDLLGRTKRISFQNRMNEKQIPPFPSGISTREEVQKSAYHVSYAYNLAGRIIKRSVSNSIGNELVAQYHHDSAGRLIRAESPEYGSLEYAYDQNNNLVKKGRLSLTLHEENNQISTIKMPEGNFAYHYDPAGLLNSKTPLSPIEREDQNIVQEISPLENQKGQRTQYSYSPENRLEAFQSLEGQADFTYDAQGRIFWSQWVGGSGKIQNQYHLGQGYKVYYENRIPVSIIKHVYQKETEIARILSSFRPENSRESLEPGSDVGREEVDSVSFKLKQKKVDSRKSNQETTSLKPMNRSSSQKEEILFPIQDRLGNLLAVKKTDSTDWKELYSYKPYGEADTRTEKEKHLQGAEKQQGIENKTSPEFTGQSYLSKLGLYDFRHRYYDAKTGSFLTPDPAYQYASGYQYSNADPTSGRDLSGMVFGLDDIVEIGILDLVIEDIISTTVEEAITEESIEVLSSENLANSVVSEIPQAEEFDFLAMINEPAQSVLDSEIGDLSSFLSLSSGYDDTLAPEQITSFKVTETVSEMEEMDLAQFLTDPGYTDPDFSCSHIAQCIFTYFEENSDSNYLNFNWLARKSDARTEKEIYDSLYASYGSRINIKYLVDGDEIEQILLPGRTGIMAIISEGNVGHAFAIVNDSSEGIRIFDAARRPEFFVNSNSLYDSNLKAVEMMTSEKWPSLTPTELLLEHQADVCEPLDGKRYIGYSKKATLFYLNDP